MTIEAGSRDVLQSLMTDEPTTQLSCTMSEARVAELRYGFGPGQAQEAMIDLGDGHHRYRIVTMGPKAKNPRHIVINWERA